MILNEFGEEIGVERAMINEGDGGALVEEWVELANGCICCTVKHSLVQALEQLVQRKERLKTLCSFLYCIYMIGNKWEIKFAFCRWKCLTYKTFIKCIYSAENKNPF